MRKLIVLPIIILFLGCTDKDFYEADCGCVKRIYLHYKENVTITEEKVDCQEEVYHVNIVDNVYYSIYCYK